MVGHGWTSQDSDQRQAFVLEVLNLLFTLPQIIGNANPLRPISSTDFIR
jgi:hypothetical protein